MCGITGIVAKDAKKYSGKIDSMIKSLKHRGPDGDGAHIFANCALGHVRLSTIDLVGGYQPMLFGNNHGGLVFNGEIYGYQEIKKSLNNYNFKTKSDTEVILALYDKYGDRFVEKLPGAFSFALWDDKTQSLICARDRFGEKPFYYATGNNGEFIFASEIKAIIASGLLEPIIDRESLAHYLKKLCVPANKTIYKNIHILPAAHFLIYKDNKIEIEKYWDAPRVQENISLEEAKEKLFYLLRESVKKQLVADIPVGAFLSGGIDSSTVVALAKEFNKNIETFSFAFKDSFNELPYAKLIADKYETKHTELFDDENEVGNVLLKLHEIYDEPFADSSAIPTYLISKLTQKHTRVALTGDGGDEMFGGYGWYKNLLDFKPGHGNIIAENTDKLIGKMISRATGGGTNIFTQKSFGHRYGRLYKDIVEAHDSQISYFSDAEISGIGLPIPTRELPSWKISNDINDAMRMDIQGYMPADILKKIDRASMSCGLELRAPFLDKELSEFAISLPYQLKLNRTEQKIILKEALGDRLPKEILEKKKKGFGAPANKWLNFKNIKEIKKEYLSNKSLEIGRIFNPEDLKRISDKDNYQTWIVLVLSLWLENNKYKIQ
jgi:asparagine synthase (glutamine-hydrolysing)